MTGTRKSVTRDTITKPRPDGAAFSLSALPHDVATYEADPDYNWRLDAYHSYLLAMELKALAVGSRRPRTVWEVYWCELHGVIP